MARHNHQLLPGNKTSGIKFNMRPRNRPRWHRQEGDHTIGGHRAPQHEPNDGYRGRRPQGRGVTIRRSHATHGGAGGQHVEHWRGRGRGSGLEGRPWAAIPPGNEDFDGRKIVIRRTYKRSGSRSRSRSSLSSNSSSSSSGSSSDSSQASRRNSNPERRQCHSSFRQTRVTSERDINDFSSRSREHGYFRRGGRGENRGWLSGGRTGVNRRMYDNDHRMLTAHAGDRNYFNDVSRGVSGIGKATNHGVHRSCSEPGAGTGINGGYTDFGRRGRHHPAVATRSGPYGDPGSREACGDNITPADDDCGDGNRPVDTEIEKTHLYEANYSPERAEFDNCGMTARRAFVEPEQCGGSVEQAEFGDVSGIEGCERCDDELLSASTRPGEDDRRGQKPYQQSRMTTSSNTQRQQQSQASNESLVSLYILDNDRGPAEDVARVTQDTAGRNDIDVPADGDCSAGDRRVAQRLGSGDVGSTLDIHARHTASEAGECLDGENLSSAGTRELERSPSGADVDKDDCRHVTGLISAQNSRTDANSQAEDIRRGQPPLSPPQVVSYPTCQTEKPPLPLKTADLELYAPSSGSSPLLHGGLETSTSLSKDTLQVGTEWIQQPRCEREKSTLRAQAEIIGPYGGSEINSAQRSDGFSSGEGVSSTHFSQVLTASTEKAMEESGAQAAAASPPAPRRGKKRGSTTDITLAQVFDHHRARRRLNGLGGESTLLAEGGLLYRNASELHGAQHTRGVNTSPSAKAAVAVRPFPDGSTVVAAAWANGDVLPLTAAAAPHMHLIAPTLAGEPEGRQVIIRTAAAVAGAAALALPDLGLEVTGVCRGGLLLELYPNVAGLQYEGDGEGSVSELCSGLANRLQSAFRRLVELDLELDTVRLPRVEAIDIVPPGSSSWELLEWRNENTAPVLRLECIPSGIGNIGQAEDRDDVSGPLNARGGGLSGKKAQYIGIDSGLGPFLPRTGLLGSFEVDIYSVMLPPPATPPIHGNHKRRSTVVHLALTLSDSSVFRGGGGGAAISRDTGDTQLFESNIMNAQGGTNSLTSEMTAVRNRKVEVGVQLACVPPTSTTGGLTWREVGGLTCLATVSKLALGPKTELDRNIRLAEGLHTAQIEALASRVATSRVLLVILAGRQGASTDVVASRLAVELMVKGKNPTVLDIKAYLRQGVSPTRDTSARRNYSNSNAVPPSQVDALALARVLATLTIQARAGTDSLRVNAGRIADINGGVVGVTPACQGCDVVIAHGSEALDNDLLSPESFGLSPTEVLSVFVDAVPQVCVDSLTPVSGSDVRMLRVLLAARGGIAADATTNCATYFDTAAFLDEWLVAEEREECLSQRFHAAADATLNTALPYDLHVLKSPAEPLLRSVAPPTGSKNGSGGGRSGGDGCRSSTYALARSVLRLLGLCDALHAPPIPESSVLSGLLS